MNNSSTYIVDPKKAERFIEDIAIIQFNFLRRVRIWWRCEDLGIDKSNDLIKDLIAFLLRIHPTRKAKLKI